MLSSWELRVLNALTRTNKYQEWFECPENEPCVQLIGRTMPFSRKDGPKSMPKMCVRGIGKKWHCKYTSAILSMVTTNNLIFLRRGSQSATFVATSLTGGMAPMATSTASYPDSGDPIRSYAAFDSPIRAFFASSDVTKDETVNSMTVKSSCVLPLASSLRRLRVTTTCEWN
jgi:hypothetical protein